jgi:hypothetical protein
MLVNLKGGHEMKCMKFKQHTLIQLIVLLLAATHALAESYTWNGGNGEWVTESNWTPNGTPGADDTATITSGNIAITGSISIGTLHVSAATITGTGTLTITTGGSISSSTLQGNGGTTVIGSGASVTLGEGETKFKERLLSIEGTLIHEGTSNILLESVLIEIKAGGTLDLRSDTLWKYNGGGAPTIRNAGTLRKSNSTGESSFELWNRKVENSGTIEALSGTLRLTHGVAEGGTFHAATGAQILINRESVLNDVSITGTGLVEFDHGWGGLTLTGNLADERVHLGSGNNYHSQRRKIHSRGRFRPEHFRPHIG